MASEAVLNVFVPLTLPNGQTDKKPIMAQPVIFSETELKRIAWALEFTRKMGQGYSAQTIKEAHFKVCCALGAMARWEREHG